MAQFPKVFPNFPPITPVVTGNQSMSLYELVGVLCDRYNAMVDLLSAIDPEDYQAARVAAEKAQASAEAAQSAAEQAQSTAFAAAVQIADFASTITEFTAVAQQAQILANAASQTAASAQSAANDAVTMATEAQEAASQAAESAANAETSAENAEASASGAAASAAAALAGLDEKLDKSGGTISGVVTFIGSEAKLVMDDLTEITGGGNIKLESAVFSSVRSGDVTASGIITGRRMVTSQGVQFAATSGQSINMIPGTSEGTGEAYVGVLNITSNGAALDERNKPTALRGIIGTGENDAVSMAQISGIADTATEAKQAAEDAAAAVDGKLDKAGGTITGNLTVDGSMQCDDLNANNLRASGIVRGATIEVGGAQAQVVMSANTGTGGNVLALRGRYGAQYMSQPVAIRNIQSQDEADAVCRREVTT